MRANRSYRAPLWKTREHRSEESAGGGALAGALTKGGQETVEHRIGVLGRRRAEGSAQPVCSSSAAAASVLSVSRLARRRGRRVARAFEKSFARGAAEQKTDLSLSLSLSSRASAAPRPSVGARGSRLPPRATRGRRRRRRRWRHRRPREGLRIRAIGGGVGVGGTRGGEAGGEQERAGASSERTRGTERAVVPTSVGAPPRAVPVTASGEGRRRTASAERRWRDAPGGSG